MGEYETDNLDLSKVYGISQKDVYYYILYSINYNNKMIRSYYNCVYNGCVKVDTSGVKYKYAYDSSACILYYGEPLENGWSIEGGEIPNGMNPQSNGQSVNGISFSIDKNVMREYKGLGYSTKSVKFKKDFSGYTSVKSLKAKVKGTSGNWFVMGISYQYPDDTSYGCFSHKICTGRETEFVITPYASGIKNLQVFFEPLDAGTYEVSDIQIE
ncbi:MAG: hypothetical protein MSA27_09765 [Spirochaetia bacterium]|nr:hypothetical protein [Spirochaetia bacterium]